jgi:hypothetical protein
MRGNVVFIWCYSIRTAHPGSAEAPGEVTQRDGSNQFSGYPTYRELSSESDTAADHCRKRALSLN